MDHLSIYLYIFHQITLHNHNLIELVHQLDTAYMNLNLTNLKEIHACTRQLQIKNIFFVTRGKIAQFLAFICDKGTSGRFHDKV